MLRLTLSITVPPQLLEREARQIPFAMANAINDVLKAGQQAQRRQMAQAFTIRRQQFAERSVKLTQFATKTALVGELAISPPGGGQRADLFTKFEQGGTKRPRAGSALAVPIVGSRVKPTERSVVRTANRPAALRQATGRRRTFVREAGDTRVLFEATGTGKRARVRPLFVLIPEAPIDKRLRFEATVTDAITDGWPAAFARRFAESTATGRG